MYGRVPEMWELLEVIERLNKENEELKDENLSLETKIDILVSKLSEIKADIKYILENGESIYIRNKYIRGDKE
jgi:predicted RNase H-like nuclease (RuvC/YqgF family)